MWRAPNLVYIFPPPPLPFLGPPSSFPLPPPTSPPPPSPRIQIPPLPPCSSYTTFFISPFTTISSLCLYCATPLSLLPYFLLYIPLTLSLWPSPLSFSSQHKPPAATTMHFFHPFPRIFIIVKNPGGLRKKSRGKTPIKHGYCNPARIVGKKEDKNRWTRTS